jgi:hypothetical protein
MDQGVSLRRVGVALEALPMGAWPDRDHSASWSTTDHLLASVLDAIRELTWVVAASMSGKKGERPKPITRPGDRRPAVKPHGDKTDWGAFAQMLRSMGASDG